MKTKSTRKKIHQGLLALQQMSEALQWVETLDLYGSLNAEGITPEQSAELEKRMYEAASESVKEGYRRLSILKVPASRRPDYYAEMVKDDKQMTKIRAQLVVAQSRIEAVESRKKKQAQKKFSKQLKAAKIEKKKQQKVEEKLHKPVMKSIDKREALNGDRKGFKGGAKKGGLKKGGSKNGGFKNGGFKKGSKDSSHKAGKPFTPKHKASKSIKKHGKPMKSGRMGKRR